MAGASLIGTGSLTRGSLSGDHLAIIEGWQREAERLAAVLAGEAEHKEPGKDA
jgi:hypothetical protein